MHDSTIEKCYSTLRTSCTTRPVQISGCLQYHNTPLYVWFCRTSENQLLQLQIYDTSEAADSDLVCCLFCKTTWKLPCGVLWLRGACALQHIHGADVYSRYDSVKIIPNTNTARQARCLVAGYGRVLLIAEAGQGANETEHISVNKREGWKLDTRSLKEKRKAVQKKGPYTPKKQIHSQNP